MRETTVGSNKYSVVPYYYGFKLKDYSLSQKIEILKSLYDFYKDGDIKKTLMVEDDVTVDEAILIFSHFIYNEATAYIDIVFGEEEITIGQVVKMDFDAGNIPAQAFLEMRKEKPFYKFIMNIVRGFKWILCCTVFDQYTSEMTSEMIKCSIEDVSDGNYKYWKDAERIMNIIENRFEQDIPKDFKIYSKSTIYRYKKKYPQWAEFITDFYTVLENGVYMNQLDQLNITRDLREDGGYLNMFEMFDFCYYKHNQFQENHEYTYDLVVMDNKRSSYDGTGVWGIPYVTTTLNGENKMNLKQMNEKVAKAKLLLNLFIKSYECFRA